MEQTQEPIEQRTFEPKPKRDIRQDVGGGMNVYKPYDIETKADLGPTKTAEQAATDRAVDTTTTEVKTDEPGA